MSRQLKPCGTNAAYARHVKAHEDPCEPCKRAHSEERRARQAGTLQLYVPEPCGTLAGSRRHRYHREPPCEACRQAANAYKNEWRAARRQTAEQRAAALAEVLAEAA